MKDLTRLCDALKETQIMAYCILESLNKEEFPNATVDDCVSVAIHEVACKVFKSESESDMQAIGHLMLRAYYQMQVQADKIERMEQSRNVRIGILRGVLYDLSNFVEDASNDMPTSEMYRQSREIEQRLKSALDIVELSDIFG